MNRPRPLPLSPVGHSPESRPDASSSLFVRIYKAIWERDWKRPVIAFATLNVLRFGFHAKISFHDLGVDSSEGASTLASIALITAGVYVAATLVEIFGLVTGITERVHYARVYLILSCFVACMVSGVIIMNVLSYHTFKAELVSECVYLILDGDRRQRTIFSNLKLPVSTAGNTILEADATTKCHHAWSTSMSAYTFGFVLLHILPNILVILFPYKYYVQLSSPSHPNATQLPSAIPLNGFPETRYTPLYNSSASIHRSAVQEASPRVGPVSARLSPGPPSFSVRPEGGYMPYDAAGMEDDRHR